MNRRLAAKKAALRAMIPALARVEASDCVVSGLFEATGELGMSVGFRRPRILLDPRAFGEHAVLRSFLLYHEGAHLALGHTRWLVTHKVASGMVVAVSLLIVVCMVGPWGASLMPAALAAWAVWLVYEERRCEIEADTLALDVMQPHAFATAVKTFSKIKKPVVGWAKWKNEILYGKTWKDRLKRVGLEAT